MESSFQFDIELYWPGWAYVNVAAGDRHVKADCSNCDDTLCEVARAVSRLAQVTGKFEVACFSESNGIWLLSFRRTDQIFEFTAKKEMSQVVDVARHRRARLKHRGEWRSNLVTILDAYRRLRNEYGDEGYKKRWGHPFPADEIALLAGAVRSP